MILKSTARLGLICMLTLFALSACGPLEPEVEATPSVAPTEMPTNTLAPTDTPVPTETPAAPPADPAAAGTPGVDAAGTPVTAGGAPTAAPTNAPVTGGSGAPDKYEYLGQNVADTTQILPNRAVSVTWTVKNSGTNAWTKEYTLRHFSGPAPDKSTYAFDKDVPAGGTINFTVTFTTPADPGTYDLWFKLTNAAGQNFGDLDLVYVVTSSPQKFTPTTAAAATTAP